MKLIFSSFGICIVLTACTNSPSINVIGSYFPGWLFCIVGGIVLEIAIYKCLSSVFLKRVFDGPMPIMFHALVACLLSLVAWIIFFRD